MSSFLAVLFSYGVILFVPVSFILVFRNGKNRPVDLLLAIAFFSMICYALNRYLFLTKSILDIPIYFKLVQPFYYLIPPCIYLYIYSLLNRSSQRARYFWWHFLPAVFILIDILPWLGLSDKERYHIVNSALIGNVSIYKSFRGVFPVWVHLVLRPLQGGLYLGFQIIYMQTVKKTNQDRFCLAPYKTFYQWASVLTAIEGIMYLCLLSDRIIAFWNMDSNTILTSMYLPGILTSVALIMSALYFYLHPSLLFDTPLAEPKLVFQTALNVEAVQPPKVVLPVFSEKTLLVYRRRLEIALAEDHLFRKKGLTFMELAKHCEIPTRALSFLLSSVYSMHFNDFINEYRLNYVVDRLKKGDSKEFTLEGLAQEGGFASRTTFFLSFKKKHGMSPTLFLQKLHHSSIASALS